MPSPSLLAQGFLPKIIEREEGTLVILAVSTSFVYWAARYRIMSDILRGD